METWHADRAIRSVAIVLTVVISFACGGTEKNDGDGPSVEAGRGAVLTAGGPAETPATAVVAIPLREGLKIVAAGSDVDTGDGQSVTSITAVTPQNVAVKISLEYSRSDHYTGTLTLRRSELATSVPYNQAVFTNRGSDPERTGTFWGPSTSVLTELKKTGATTFVNLVPPRSVAARLRGKPEMATVRIRRTDTQVTTFPVIVNNRLSRVPTIEARGTVQYEEGPPMDVQFVFLDDADNPVTLRRTQASRTGDVTHIWFPTEKKAPDIERQLEDTGRAEVYGIYFDLGEARIKPDFESVFQQIRDALMRKEQWKLRVEGHTDSIGSERDNQELSERRADAVRRELIEHYGIDAGRLTAVGFGESKPLDTNETLIGRAQNRRVELVRQ
jgi:outer membrane protein OmpA-like peptidoglycan-associated protein